MSVLLIAFVIYLFLARGLSAAVPTDPGVPDLRTRASARAWHTLWWPQTYGAAMGFTGDVPMGIPGDLAPDFRNQALLRYNMFRRMVGVQPFVFDAGRNQQAQLAAMFIAANDHAQHGFWPTTAKFYSPEADQATAECMLGLGWNDPEEGWGYLYDFGDANIGVVGHRAYLLAPWMAPGVGIGNVPASASTQKAQAFALKATVRPPVFAEDGFVAWPCAGYVPHFLVTGQWNIDIPDQMTTGKWSFKVATLTVLKNGVPQTITGGPLGSSGGMVWTIDGTEEGNSQYHWSTWATGERFYGNPNGPKDIVYHVIIDGIRKRVTPPDDPGAPDQGGGELYMGTGRYEYDVIGYNPDLAGGLAISTQPVSQTIQEGDYALLTVEATGASSYQWYKDWVALPGATKPWVQLSNFKASDAGRYHVLVQGESGALLSDYVTLSHVATQPSEGKLVNVSTRSHVSGGDSVLVGGFVIDGTQPKQLLIRAAGPALRGQIPMPELADTELALFDGSSRQIAYNDDWSSDPAKAELLEAAGRQAWAGAWARGSKDSALLVTLPPGLYTAQVKGKGTQSGIALVEIFELGNTGTTRMVNISGRSMNALAGEPSIPGFCISGITKKKVLIRAAGPALVGAVDRPMADPELVLFNAKREQLASNDDWSSDPEKVPALEAAFSATWAAKWVRGSKDAALLLELEPGLYTAYGRGKGDATGITLVEVYEVP